MTDKQLMQMALDCLLAWEEESSGYGWSMSDQECVEALRARLAQPEQEPVAWMYNGNLHLFDPSDWADGTVTPLYNSPPQREWQGLTDEEIMKITGVTSSDSDWNVKIVHKWIRAIEHALKEKNYG